MYVLIELWKARSPWCELSSARREEYLASVVPAIQQLLSDGVELMAIEVAGNGNADGKRQQDYDSWAVWRLPHQSQLQAFFLALQKVGWNEFFEPVPLDVEGRAVEDILGEIPTAILKEP